MYSLPSLYKARGLSVKRPVCAICIDRTKGRTEEVRLGYRVTVWLCPGHASHAFQTKRSGRDFVRTLMGVWQANGCMTQARHRALDAHLNQLRTPPPRPRPGSYAWPELRRHLEARYAQGAPPADPRHLQPGMGGQQPEQLGPGVARGAHDPDAVHPSTIRECA